MWQSAKVTEHKVTARSPGTGRIETWRRIGDSDQHSKWLGFKSQLYLHLLHPHPDPLPTTNPILTYTLTLILI